MFFDKAISRAAELDAHFARTGQTIGPLHGVPVSIKDSFNVAGYDSSIGIAALTFNAAKSTAPVAEILLRAGAVLYCKTNVPQLLIALDSHNNVFGRVLNPRNIALSAGGSSGGEGALIAIRGSVLGVGTDVGGSIRIPAMCNGLYGVKPSVGRVPYLGQQGAGLPGASKMSMQASAGPLATSVRDCDLFLRTIAEGQPWDYDSEVVHGDWASQGTIAAGKKEDIVIGIVRRDGVIEPLPPIQNVLNDTVAALKADGITVVEMDITPLFSQCQSLANSVLTVDGSNHHFDLLEKTGEPLSPWLQGRLRRKQPLTLSQARALHGRREVLRNEFLSVWKDKSGRKIDAFICPVAPHPVPPIDRWNGVSYTSSFVLLDLPSASLPVRPLRHSDLTGSLPSKVIGSWDERNRDLWNNVDKSVYLDSPLSIQVVAPRLQERRLLETMKIIDEALKKQNIGSVSTAKL